jgi:hypothetical protein
VTIAVEQDAGARDGDRQNLRCWVGLVSKRCANDLMPNDTIAEAVRVISCLSSCLS